MPLNKETKPNHQKAKEKYSIRKENNKFAYQLELTPK